MDIEVILLNEMMKIISCIKENQYDRLEQEGYLEHLSKEEVTGEIQLYGGKITNAEYDEYKKSHQYIRISNTNVYKSFLEFWIDNSQSDLTLICDILVDDDLNIVKSTIEEVHVL